MIKHNIFKLIYLGLVTQLGTKTVLAPESCEMIGVSEIVGVIGPGTRYNFI